MNKSEIQKLIEKTKDEIIIHKAEIKVLKDRVRRYKFDLSA